FTNAITGAIGSTGMCYAGNVLVFDPNLLEDVNATTSAETGRPKATLAAAMPDGTSNTICFAHRYKVCSSSIYGTTRNPWCGNPQDQGRRKAAPGVGLGGFLAGRPRPRRWEAHGDRLRGFVFHRYLRGGPRHRHPVSDDARTRHLSTERDAVAAPRRHDGWPG